MKKINLLILLAFLFNSCSDWLDLTPSNTVVEEEMFKEASGYHNAINGLYKSMVKPELYGRELTFGFVEVLSQNYVQVTSYGEGIKNYSPWYNLFQYKYTENEETKDIISDMWENAYKTIANANNIIKHIGDAQNGWFKYGEVEKGLIHGEALAVRAMLHFDMLRLFAPAPILNDSKPYIPYVEEFPYYGGQAKESVESVMTKIEKDLLQAKDLICAYDTLDVDRRELLANITRFELSTGASNSDMFYHYRGYRMNALAVTGLLARVYNYWGKHDEAFKYAQQVANFNSQPGYYALKYENGWTAKSDRKFSPEIIFTLSNPKLYEDYMGYTGTSANEYLNINTDVVKFEGVPEADPADTRLYLLNTDGWYGYAPLKNVENMDANADITARIRDMVPLIRLSEMHLIMAEYAASKNDFAKANEYMNLLRVGRNCVEMDLRMKNMDDFKKQLFMEVRKEYFNEGHTFYYYKKYNTLITTKMIQENFVVPTPDSENIN